MTPTDAHHLADGTEASIGHDLPCQRCGYNLRGLTALGKCPECGQSVGGTLAVQLAQNRVRDEARAMEELLEQPPTFWEAREIAWGCLLLLLAAVPIMTFALSPAEWEVMRYRGAVNFRRVLLADLCASWVLGWHATLKLTRGDRQRRGKIVNEGLSGSLVLVSTAYAVTPFLAGTGPVLQAISGIDPRNRVIELGPCLLLPLGPSGVALTVLLPLWLRVLARRVGRPRLAGEARVLAVLSPVAFLFSISLVLNRGYGYRGPNSLDFMSQVPQLFFGPPLLYRKLLHTSHWDDHRAWFVATILIIALWHTSLVLRLLAAHVPLLRGDAHKAPLRAAAA